MKNLKTYLVLFAVIAFACVSCDDEDMFSIGEEKELPTEDFFTKGYDMGVIFADAMYAIRDTVNKATEEKLLNTTYFSGMLTAPLSKAQYPFQLAKEKNKVEGQTEEEQNWMSGFWNGVLSKIESENKEVENIYNEYNLVLTDDIDNESNAQHSIKIAEILNSIK